MASSAVINTVRKRDRAPLGPQLLHRGEEHHAVEHRDAEEGDEADARADRERGVAAEEAREQAEHRGARERHLHGGDGCTEHHDEGPARAHERIRLQPRVVHDLRRHR